MKQLNILVSVILLAVFTHITASGISHHLACIMDSNRSWTRRLARPDWYKHRVSILFPLYAAIATALERRIPHLSVYLCSQENMKRSNEEKQCIYNSLYALLTDKKADFFKHSIAVCIYGDTQYMPPHITPYIDTIHHETQTGKNLTSHVIFSYSGVYDIVREINHIHTDSQQTHLPIPSHILLSYVTTNDIPDPDIIMRTGTPNCLRTAHAQ
mgnify:FL=1